MCVCVCVCVCVLDYIIGLMVLIKRYRVHIYYLSLLEATLSSSSSMALQSL